ncbi:MAG: MarR family transcriptional regulator [Bacteroidota bacterium]
MALGPLNQAPAYLIYRLSRLLRLNLRQVLDAQETDVTPEQYFLLYRLYERDGRAQNELADRALGDYPNMTRMVDGLERKALVERRDDPDDRRRSLVWLTPKGQATMRSLEPAIERERGRLFGDIDAAALQAALHVLADLQTRLIE